MKALVYHRYGAIDQLHIEDVPTVNTAKNAIVVSVTTVALNPKDALFRKGKFAVMSGRKFPKYTGVDFAGTVLSANSSAGLTIGTRVFGALYEWKYNRGTLAEQVSV